MDINTLSFTFPEMLSLIGLTQCVYLLVHIAFQPRKISLVVLPILYFLLLGTAFLSDAMSGHFEIWRGQIFYLQWVGWFMGPPLSVLLVIQMADLNKTPPLKDFWVLLLLPLSLLLSSVTVNPALECTLSAPCQELKDLLRVMGLMAGTISILVIFSKKDIFKNLRKQKHGAERYWLVLSLILLNTFFLGAIFASITHALPAYIDIGLLRTILGLGFVYLVSTSLLRMFPKEAKPNKSAAQEELSQEEQVLAQKIENLLNLEKVYHEQTYARSDLARECGASEMLISKVINIHFQKSFPQIMNERRIEDAKRLLVETDAAVKTVAEEVGFNSLPSFNRVFKELTDESPGLYRKNHKKSSA